MKKLVEKNYSFLQHDEPTGGEVHHVEFNPVFVFTSTTFKLTELSFLEKKRKILKFNRSNCNLKLRLQRSGQNF